jgi:hypothetical protein
MSSVALGCDHRLCPSLEAKARTQVRLKDKLLLKTFAAAEAASACPSNAAAAAAVKANLSARLRQSLDNRNKLHITYITYITHHIHGIGFP